MNILYIFGNGFDKAQGMATSYPEFYKYLQEHVTSGSNLLNRMKAEITEDRKLWSDMEERLGAFTDVSNNADEFYDFYFELNEHLQSYLSFYQQINLRQNFRTILLKSVNIWEH